ncbi:MAG: cytochrome c oxidase subunit 3 [Luteibaculaceae bacterium]
MVDNYTEEEYAKQKDKASENLLYISLVSIVMLFAGLTSAYVVSHADNFWMVIDLPAGFYTSTAIILVSSVTVWLAKKAIEKNDKQKLKLYLGVTLALGLAFTVIQFRAWGQMIEIGSHPIANLTDLKGQYGEDFWFTYGGSKIIMVDDNYYFEDDPTFTTPLTGRVEAAKNTASAYIYIFSFVHLLHVVGGIIYLLRVFIAANKGKYSDRKHLPVKLSGYYWHFVDILWVYLLIFLMFYNR